MFFGFFFGGALAGPNAELLPIRRPEQSSPDAETYVHAKNVGSGRKNRGGKICPPIFAMERWRKSRQEFHRSEKGVGRNSTGVKSVRPRI